MAYYKRTPQQQRRAMIGAMQEMILNLTKDGKEVDVQMLKENFMFSHGSSKTRTDEYFDLVVKVSDRNPYSRCYFVVIDGKISQVPKDDPNSILTRKLKLEQINEKLKKEEGAEQKQNAEQKPVEAKP